ncbi:MAG: metalloregulator ArsR/SmtB family transcription factor [Sedimentibacter sp.]|uniref:ArsR/SmtB family transcription factor n=1 Tax=Sedimentibacter sp. TaxID=1960295 RepID=UPI0031582D25
MEDKDFEDNFKVIKALSDINRMKIIRTLIGGELCACKILKEFDITQPTLSHHMKVLSECGLVVSRKEGKWMHYMLNAHKIEQFQDFITELTTIK